MTEDAPDGWRWTNVPLPRSHLAGLALGVLLQRRRSWTLPIPRRLSVSVGLSAVCLSALVIGWSVLTMGRVTSSDPDQLVDQGPYARSRNPMYVAWTGLYLGLAFLFRSSWILVFTPVVVAAVHWTVVREEGELERSFGETYRSYQARVPRYV